MQRGLVGYLVAIAPILFLGVYFFAHGKDEIKASGLFLDLGLEQCVRETLLLSESKFPPELLDSVTDLNCRESGIERIEGIDRMPNLVKLYLSKNSITDIGAIRGLTHLRQLALSGNNISDIRALAKLTDLEVLSLKNNPIVDISPLKGLQTLVMLELEGACVSDFTPLEGYEWYVQEPQGQCAAQQ